MSPSGMYHSPSTCSSLEVRIFFSMMLEEEKEEKKEGGGGRDGRRRGGEVEVKEELHSVDFI